MLNSPLSLRCLGKFDSYPDQRITEGTTRIMKIEVHQI